jgi:hypothetical protein
MSLKETIEELKIEMSSGAPDIHITQEAGPVPPPAKNII